MRSRSLKAARDYVKRRKLVAAILEERSTCQRCDFKRSTEVHELLSRARGGSILDPENCVALCHDCHHWITTHPKEAEATGWSRSALRGMSDSGPTPQPLPYRARHLDDEAVI